MPIVPTLTALIAIPAQPTKPIRRLFANALNEPNPLLSESNVQARRIARTAVWLVQPALPDGGQPKA